MTVHTTKRLLFVCQANILRSAAAEALARSMAPHSGWQFASAGVGALVDSPAHPDVAAALAARGVVASTHRARQLSAPILREADLIFTFEVSQRAWVIREDPRRARSTLTIRRAAAILAADRHPAPHAESRTDPTRARAGAATAASAGGLDLLRADPHRYGPDDDFSDPIGQGPQSIAAAVDEIEALLRVILPSICTNGSQGETAP